MKPEIIVKGTVEVFGSSKYYSGWDIDTTKATEPLYVEDLEALAKDQCNDDE